MTISDIINIEVLILIHEGPHIRSTRGEEPSLNCINSFFICKTTVKPIIRDAPNYITLECLIGFNNQSYQKLFKTTVLKKHVIQKQVIYILNYI